MKQIDFEKGDGLVPAIVQDHVTRQVLMLGYMNEEALRQTRESGRVTFYSRSKQRLWTKGEESGNYLDLQSVRIDCDGDALLVYARPTGPVCHTGSDTCWNEANHPKTNFLDRLEQVIAARKSEWEAKGSSAESYVVSLFEKGISKIAQKVGEEAVETVIEAMGTDRDLFLNENADLLFHQLVLLHAKGFSLSDVLAVLESRHATGR